MSDLKIGLPVRKRTTAMYRRWFWEAVYWVPQNVEWHIGLGIVAVLVVFWAIVRFAPLAGQ